jgi:ABC-2 type transport system ATP-binding protein
VARAKKQRPARPAAAPVVLEVRELRRAYGRLVALERLDLKVRAGEVVALLGPNGSGKSTAVKCIAGHLKPSAGTVKIGGADIHDEAQAAAARAELAMVPDNPLLYEDLDVRQHLELVAAAHGVAEPDVDGLLGRLGLTERADFLPGELSRGLRQRAMLACALVRPFSLLVLDEPVVGLDPPAQRALAERLEALAQEGTAVLFTTHQLGFARRIASRALRLEDGRVADLGPLEEVLSRAEAAGWDEAWT